MYAVILPFFHLHISLYYCPKCDLEPARDLGNVPVPIFFSSRGISVILPLIASAHEILTLISHFWLLNFSLFLIILLIFLSVLKDVTVQC